MAHEFKSNVLILGPMYVSTVRSFLPNFVVRTALLNSVTRLRCAEFGIPASGRVMKNLQSDIISLPVQILRGFPQSFGKMRHVVHPDEVAAVYHVSCVPLITPLACILLVVHP
jgi:hypothetical protein